MVKHCGGLPLAVVVLGGLMATKNTLDEWEMVHRNINYYLSKTKDHRGLPVKDVLALSYQDLPYHLKACFLYLSHLPEDHDIRPEKLIHMWIAERIVSSPLDAAGARKQETMLEIGMSYLDDLIERCMVQVGQFTRYSQRVKRCRLHDLMRDFCLLKAQEENFFKVVCAEAVNGHLMWANSVPSSSSPCSSLTTRRLAMHYFSTSSGNVMDPHYEQEITNHYHHVRSFHLFLDEGRLESSIWEQIKSLLKGFKLLTVLDLEGINFGGGNILPKSIGSLIHLSYFSVRHSYGFKLPPSIGNLRFLQTLDLRVKYHWLVIPNILWRLEELRHLYLPRDFKFFRGYKKLRLDGMSKLETLNFHTRFCEVGCFPKLKNLRKVRIDCDDLKDLAVILDSPILATSISSNQQLPPRDLDIYIAGHFDTKEDEYLLRRLLEFQYLHKLELRAYLKQVTNLADLPVFPQNLTNLTLCWSGLKKDPMPTLEKLPNLRKLDLDSSSYEGKEMVCSRSTSAPTTSSTDADVVCGSDGIAGFPQLKYLCLGNLQNLEEWRVEEGAMPNLLRLEIGFCDKLKEIPDGLRFIKTLKELEIRFGCEQLRERLREDGGQDFYKVQHVPSIRIN